MWPMRPDDIPGATVFVAVMPDDFDSYLETALQKKKVPLLVVPMRAEAESEDNGQFGKPEGRSREEDLHGQLAFRLLRRQSAWPV